MTDNLDTFFVFIPLVLTFRLLLSHYTAKQHHKIPLSRVLEGARRQIEDLESAINIAVHYLLSEIAFLEFAASYLGVAKVSYVYHKNWPVYEDYIAGKFGGGLRSHMDFLLMENPQITPE